MTGDHIRQRLVDVLTGWWVGETNGDGARITAEYATPLAAALEQTVRDLIADELDAAAEEIWAYRDMPVTYLQDRAAVLRARTEETT